MNLAGSRVVLCADDFGLSPDISRTIAELALSGCINATSCMVVLPSWAVDAQLLNCVVQSQKFSPERVQIGLHLVLSHDGRACAPMSFPGLTADELLLQSIAGRLDYHMFRSEIHRQFDAFEDARGARPDFVDAHQHVHVYPGLRHIIIEVVAQRAPDAWVRVPSDRLHRIIHRPFRAKAIGSSLHSLGMRKALHVAGLGYNRTFAGHYDFQGRFGVLLPIFLEHDEPGHLVMCHPGAGKLAGDAIAVARREEARVLKALSLPRRLRTLGLQPAEVGLD